MKKIKCNILFMVVIPTLVAEKCNIYNKIAADKKPSESSYKTLEIEKFPEQRCLGICTYDSRCLSFVVEKFHSKYQCRFYNTTVHMLTLVDNAWNHYIILYFIPYFEIVLIGIMLVLETQVFMRSWLRVA